MKLKKTMSPKWDNIHLVQKKLGEKLKGHDKGYIDSVKMVAGELLENSVKYYMKKGIHKPIKFLFNNNDGILICISKQIIEKEDFDIFEKIVNKIEKSHNPYNLFVERLQEILDNRVKGESKLGLLRVASDGGYQIRYTYVKNKLSIYAEKSKEGESIRMKALDFEGLKIGVMEADDIVKISFIGTCRIQNPEKVLDTYLAQLVQFSKGKNIIVSFDKLNSMNSSTVPPLLTFIKTLEHNKISSQFLYNDEEDWQRASFKPLSVIVGKYEYVKIKAINYHKIS